MTFGVYKTNSGGYRNELLVPALINKTAQVYYTNGSIVCGCSV
jgi:hypothetical protein